MTTPPDDRGEASLARKTPSPHIHPSTAGEAFAAGAALAYWLPPPAPPLSLRDQNQHPSRSRQHACPVARPAAARAAGALVGLVLPAAPVGARRPAAGEAQRLPRHPHRRGAAGPGSQLGTATLREKVGRSV